MNHVKYQLKKPIQFGEETVTNFLIRDEVVSGDLRGIKISQSFIENWDDILILIARLSGQPAAVVNKMSMADLNEVGGLVVGFLKAGQETGK